MQELRDNPECAREEYARLEDAHDPGLHARLSYDPSADVAAPFIASGARPAIAILREQGVNSHIEMAAVFTRSGFDAYDVHMTDILAGRVRLGRFHGLVACGGFSYGDVLGAGEGWAKSILFNARAREEFAAFFARDATFTLGVCNGCQMLAALKELIPGAEAWPRFVRNRSEQYEARLSLVRIPKSNSVLFAGMHGSVLPIAVAHGEGRAEFEPGQNAAALLDRQLVTLQYVDHRDQAHPQVPVQSQWFGAGPGGAVQPRWPRHCADAAPRTRISQRAEFLGAQGMGRGRRLDAVVPQRAGVCRTRLAREPGRPRLLRRDESAERDRLYQACLAHKGLIQQVAHDFQQNPGVFRA